MEAPSEEGAMHPCVLKTKIATPLLARTRDFYVTCLGMGVVDEWHKDRDVGCILALPCSSSEALLEIYEASETNSFAGLSLQFRTDDLESFRKGLPATIEVRGPVEKPWGSSYLYLTDPNGIPVVVFEGRF